MPFASLILPVMLAHFPPPPPFKLGTEHERTVREELTPITLTVVLICCDLCRFLKALNWHY